MEIKAVCDIAGVTVSRRNLLRAKVKVGQTQAVSALARCLDTYGRNTLISALQCITQTGGGNPGYVRAGIVEALCRVLYVDARWRDAGGALLDAMDDFDFDDAWEAVLDGRSYVSSEAAIVGFAEKVRTHLSKRQPSPRLGSKQKQAA